MRFCSFYKINEIIGDIPTLMGIIGDLELSDAILLINKIDFLFEGPKRKSYVNAIKSALDEAIDIYCSDIPADAYDVDVTSILADCTYDDEIGIGCIDGDAAAEEVEDLIRNTVINELSDMISSLPSDIIINNNYLNKFTISISGSTSLVEGYLMDKPDYDYDDYYEDQIENNDRIDLIFNR